MHDRINFIIGNLTMHDRINFIIGNLTMHNRINFIIGNLTMHNRINFIIGNLTMHDRINFIIGNLTMYDSINFIIGNLTMYDRINFIIGNLTFNYTCTMFMVLSFPCFHHLVIFVALVNFTGSKRGKGLISNLYRQAIAAYRLTTYNIQVHAFCQYSPTPVIRTSVIRYLDYPNTVPDVKSAKNKWYTAILTKIADSATEQRTCVCVSYVYVQCSPAVVRHCVQCEV